MKREPAWDVACAPAQNGLSTGMYWLAQYVHFYILHIIASLVFIAAGWIFRLEFFTLTDPAVRLVHLFSRALVA